MQFVSAAVDTIPVQDTFKLNDLVDYKKPCYNNGSYCSATATCNYTIIDPKNRIIVDNKVATNQGSFYNYSFYVSTIGVHTANMICKDGDLTGNDTFYFDVTGNGFNTSLGFYIFVLLISAGLIVLGFTIKDAWTTIFGTFGLYFLGIYILLNGIVGIQDMITTWSMGLIVLGVAGYISVESAIEVVQENLE